MSKRIILLLLTSFLISCKIVEYNLLSPKEKIRNITSQNILKETWIDTLRQIKNFSEIGNIWLIAVDDKIILYDYNSKKIKKAFQYDISSVQYLFDHQDSVVGYNFVDFYFNKQRDKVLIQSSNGILTLIDLITLDIKWTIKFINRIETATFSNNDSVIAIGTSYDNSEKCNYFFREYYATIFTLSSDSGEFLNYYHDDASVLKILFLPDNTKILVLYDWNNTDTFLWDVNKTSNHLFKYDDDDNLQDGIIINDSTFITIATRHLSLWSINNPLQKQILTMNGYGTIIKKQNTNEYLYLINDSLYYFNNNLGIIQCVGLNTSYQRLQVTSNPNIVLFKSDYAPYPQKSNPSYYFYDLEKKKIIYEVNISLLNNLFCKEK